MLRKWIKIVLLFSGLISLFLIANSIQKPFWQEQDYKNTVINFQKDQDIFPYRVRNIWWNKTIIAKSTIERGIDILWKGNYFYLPLIFLLWLIKKKKWWSVGLIILGLILISIEKDPDPGKYLLYLIPFYLWGFIK